MFWIIVVGLVLAHFVVGITCAAVWARLHGITINNFANHKASNMLWWILILPEIALPAIFIFGIFVDHFIINHGSFILLKIRSILYLTAQYIIYCTCWIWTSTNGHQGGKYAIQLFPWNFVDCDDRYPKAICQRNANFCPRTRKFITITRS